MGELEVGDEIYGTVRGPSTAATSGRGARQVDLASSPRTGSARGRNRADRQRRPRLLTNRGWKHVHNTDPGERDRPHLTMRNDSSEPARSPRSRSTMRIPARIHVRHGARRRQLAQYSYERAGRPATSIASGSRSVTARRCAGPGVLAAGGSPQPNSPSQRRRRPRREVPRSRSEPRSAFERITTDRVARAAEPRVVPWLPGGHLRCRGLPQRVCAAYREQRPGDPCVDRALRRWLGFDVAATEPRTPNGLQSIRIKVVCRSICGSSTPPIQRSAASGHRRPDGQDVRAARGRRDRAARE